MHAAHAYRGWLRDSGPEPTVVWYDEKQTRHCFEIGVVADFCMNFTDDRMPDKLYDVLLELSKPANNGEYVPASKSYADGAKCLRALIRHELARQAK